MKQIVQLTLILLMLAPGQLSAGAWPREVGSFFLSATAVHDLEAEASDPEVSLYGEYGLRHNITLSGKLTYDFSESELSGYEIGARWHFTNPDKPLQAALSLTVAGPEDDIRVSPGVHFGRGFSTPLGDGWVDVLMAANISTQSQGTDYEGFATFGLKPVDRLMTMVGMDISMTDTDTFVKAIPSVAWELSEGKHVNMKYVHGLQGTETRELGVGLWLEF